MIKIPLLGFSFSGIIPFFTITKIVNYKFVLKPVLFIGIFILIQYIFSQTSFLELMTGKKLIGLFSGTVFGVFLMGLNPEKIKKIIFMIIFILLTLFCLTYIFKDLSIFQYSREYFAGDNDSIGILPLYLKTNKISFSGLTSDPNLAVSSLLMFYSLFTNKFKIKELIPFLLLALACSSTFNFLLISFLIIICFFKVEDSQLKRISLVTFIIFSSIILADGFNNIRWFIWQKYITGFLERGIQIFGFSTSNISFFNQVFITSSHNTFIDIYLYAGIIGLVSFIWLIYIFCKNKEESLTRGISLVLSIFAISYFNQPIFYTLFAIIINPYTLSNMRKLN